MNKKTLLVVVDMQNDFVDGALGTAEAVNIVPAVVEKVQQYPNRVFTADTHFENYLSTQEGKNLPVPHCIKGTLGHEIIPQLQPHIGNSEIIEKPGFGSPQLGSMVKSLFDRGEIDQVELIGLCTDICVISNAMIIKGMCPEIPITVDAACCAGVTPESHRQALSAMKVCQIAVTNAC